MSHRSLAVLLAFAAAACDVTKPAAPADIVAPVALIDHANATSATGANGANPGEDEPTLTIPSPGGVGDFLLAQITFEKGTAITNLVSPAGWTLVRRDNFGSDIGQAILYRVVAGGEPASYTWEFRKSATEQERVRAVGGITRYAGVNLLHPDGPIVESSGASGDGTSLTAPGINGVEDAVLVAMFGHKKQTTLTDPSGMANLYQEQHSNQSGPTIRASQEQLAAGGATGSRSSSASATVGGDKWVAQLVALRSNTKPVYTAPADQAADEGEAKGFDLGSFVDPDNHPSWEITVAWGDGSSEAFTYHNTNPADPFAARALGTRNHTYDDGDLVYEVTVTVDDGIDASDGTFDVAVANVAPTADFSNDGPVIVGSPVTASFSAQSDPSQADTDAGFHYAFSCTNDDLAGATYANSGTSASTTCVFASAGEHTVRGRIIDKDGGFSEYTTVVTVTAPSGLSFYLHNRSTQPSGATTSQANLPMDATVPANEGDLPNYDTDRDAFAGRLIQKGGTPPGTDLGKYQNWVSAPLAADWVINPSSSAQVTIWTAMKDLDAVKIGRIHLFIRHCSAALTGCVELGSAIYVRPAGAAFSEAVINVALPADGLTVPAGRRVEVKVVVQNSSQDDMWLGYDTAAMDAQFVYPQP